MQNITALSEMFAYLLLYVGTLFLLFCGFVSIVSKMFHLRFPRKVLVSLFSVYLLWLSVDAVSYYTNGYASLWWRAMIFEWISPPDDAYDPVVSIQPDANKRIYAFTVRYKYEGDYYVGIGNPDNCVAHMRNGDITMRCVVSNALGDVLLNEMVEPEKNSLDSVSFGIYVRHNTFAMHLSKRRFCVKVEVEGDFADFLKRNPDARIFVKRPSI